MSFESKAAGVKNAAVGGGLLLAIIGVGVVGYIVWSNRKIVTEKLNPASDKNVAYQTTNGVARSVANIFSDTPVNEDSTVGTLAFDAVDTIKGWFGFGDAAAEKKRQEEVAAILKAREVGRQPILTYGTSVGE